MKTAGAVRKRLGIVDFCAVSALLFMVGVFVVEAITASISGSPGTEPSAGRDQVHVLPPPTVNLPAVNEAYLPAAHASAIPQPAEHVVTGACDVVRARHASPSTGSTSGWCQQQPRSRSASHPRPAPVELSHKLSGDTAELAP